MGNILFFDPACQRPYDTQTLNQQALGGTEASCVRVADALGAFVMQHNRERPCGRYLPPAKIDGIEQVVILRDARVLPQLRTQFPRARFHFWVHDQLRPGSSRARRLRATAAVLQELAVNVICVSDTQRRMVEATLGSLGIEGTVRAMTIYNPVEVAAADSGVPYRDNQLVFFSSPNKGLAYTLDVFRALRRRMPGMLLSVANPGYKPSSQAAIEGVVYLGAIAQPQIHQLVRSSLCTLALNFVLPETFGLVYAESLALGTPVLAHDAGAAAEVIADRRQVLPVRRAHRVYERLVHQLPAPWRSGPARLAERMGLFDECCERIRAWRSGGRPMVGPDPRFALETVVARWRALLAA